MDKETECKEIKKLSKNNLGKSRSYKIENTDVKNILSELSRGKAMTIKLKDDEDTILTNKKDTTQTQTLYILIQQYQDILFQKKSRTSTQKKPGNNNS